MNPKLRTIADRQGGWFARQDALASGYSDHEIRTRMRSKAWLRLCRDVYVDQAHLRSGFSDPDEPRWSRRSRLHAIKAKALRHRAGRDHTISHQSAVVLHGLPTWGLDLGRVHLTSPGGRGRSDKLARIHGSRLPRDDVTTVDGVPVTTPARAVVEAAAAAKYATAVVLMDAVLQRKLATAEELQDVVKRLRHWRGAPTVAAALRFADPLSESPGESRLRIILDNAGLPKPRPQAEIKTTDGRFVARVDFLFPEHRLVVEFDGAVKYSERSDVVSEKWREDRIRELGYTVIRISWDDLDSPDLILARVRRALMRAA